MRIDKIRIVSFRGATNPVEVIFDDRPITLIFGENGTGKSTIVDAIDFVCNQKLGSLENMSVGIRAKSYLPSLGSTTESVNVEIHSGNDTWRARFSGKEIIISPVGTCPKASIMRRAEITNLITAQPSKRYEELQKFVAAPIVDSNEAALKKALEQKRQEMENCGRLAEQARHLLQLSYWEEKNIDGDYLTWAETETKKDVTDLELNVRQLTSIITSYDRFTQDIVSYGEYKTDKKDKEDALQEAREILGSVLEKTALHSVELLDVLKAAEGFIDKNSSVTTCPVCEQSIDAKDLRKSLSKRVDDMQELTQAVKTEKTALDSLNKTETLLGKQSKLLIQSTHNLALAIGQCRLAILEPYQKTAKDLDHLSGIEEIDLGVVEKVISFYEELRKQDDTWRSQRSETQKSIDQNRLIKVNLKAYRDSINNGKELEKLCGKLKEAHDIHEQARQREIDGILASLSGDIDNLYYKLHPDEKIGMISLYLKENARASLMLDASFENLSNVPPHAYYSESHIDTLGICIFLVLAKYNNADVVVLDDVLTSVDSQHLNRFIDMLSHITAHFPQIIVATHYRPWMERYRKGRGQLSNTNVIELGPWSRSNGVRTKAFTNELELLKREL